MASRLKEQLEAAREETDNWPAWRRMEIEVEVAKTPLRRRSEGNESSGEAQKQADPSRRASDI